MVAFSWKNVAMGVALVAGGAGGMEGAHMVYDKEVVVLGEMAPGSVEMLACPRESAPCLILVPKAEWDEVTGGAPAKKF